MPRLSSPNQQSPRDRVGLLPQIDIERVERATRELDTRLNTLENATPEPVDSLPAGTSGAILYHDGADWVTLSVGPSGKFLGVSSGLPAWVDVSALPPGAAGNLLYHNGTAWVTLAVGASGTVLSSTGTAATWSPLRQRALDIIATVGPYVLQLADAGCLVEVTGNVTVPANASVAFPVGTEIAIVNITGSPITIGPANGVSLQSSGNFLTLRTQWATCALTKRDTNSWLVVGDVT